MRVLVVGTRQVNAGKTTFTRGLIAATGARAYKPRAANDRWYHYDTYRHAIEAGRLYGRDAQLLATEQPHPSTIESINPIHRLWQPTPDPDGGLLGQPHREFVVDRVGTDYILNANATIPPALSSALPLRDAHIVESVDALNDLVRDHYLPILTDLEHRIREHPWAVVEAYCDVGTPLYTLRFDLVAVVEPGRVRYYDGSRYAKASQVIGGRPQKGVLEPTVPDIVDPLTPRATGTLPPLPAVDQDDPTSIRRAYRTAYERLLTSLPEETDSG